MLFLESFGVAPDVVAPCEPVTVLHVFHSEGLIMPVAHVTDTKMYGGAVRRGGQHHLSHDSRDIQFLRRFLPLCLLGLIGVPTKSLLITHFHRLIIACFIVGR